jgi:hypothetical protein
MKSEFLPSFLEQQRLNPKWWKLTEVINMHPKPLIEDEEFETKG